MSILSSGREPVLPTYGTGTRAAHRCVWFSLYNPGLMVFFKKCEFIAKTFFKGRLVSKIQFFFLTFSFEKHQNWQYWACFPLGDQVSTSPEEQPLPSDRQDGQSLTDHSPHPSCLPTACSPHSLGTCLALQVANLVACVKSCSRGRACFPLCCGSQEGGSFHFYTWTECLPILPCAVMSSQF